jgi:hypothetical protein
MQIMLHNQQRMEAESQLCSDELFFPLTGLGFLFVESRNSQIRAAFLALPAKV